MNLEVQKSLDFPLDREKMLDEIFRWKVCQNFFHRSSVWLHAQRVRLMVDALARVAAEFLPGYNAKKARLIAVVHDDPEILTGDHQACHKATWSAAKKRRVAKQELEAIGKLAGAFPGSIEGYNYGELLLWGHRKECAESQLMKWCDKLDSYCEATHEVLAGNNTPLPMRDQDIIFLYTFTEKYPLVRPLLKRTEEEQKEKRRRKHPLLDLPIVIRTPLGGKARPHTPKSVREKTDFPYYNRWREIILKGLGHKGMDYLVNVDQKELFDS